jgi:hypothetical protein
VTLSNSSIRLMVRRVTTDTFAHRTETHHRYEQDAKR